MKVLELGKMALCLGPLKGFRAVVCESLVNFTPLSSLHSLMRIDRLTCSLEDVEHLKGTASPSNPTKFTKPSDEAVSNL